MRWEWGEPTTGPRREYEAPRSRKLCFISTQSLTALHFMDTHTQLEFYSGGRAGFCCCYRCGFGSASTFRPSTAEALVKHRREVEKTNRKKKKKKKRLRCITSEINSKYEINSCDADADLRGGGGTHNRNSNFFSAVFALCCVVLRCANGGADGGGGWGVGSVNESGMKQE